MKYKDFEIDDITLVIIAWLLFIVIIACFASCTPAREVEYIDIYQSGGLFVENDTVIGKDTLFIWNDYK